MTKLIASSVVRGSHQGESHGGIYLIDLDQQQSAQVIDWNTANIDWQGRGWDRGLRGIEFDGEAVYIAASDELFMYTPDFELIGSWRSPYLKHCHEIARYERRLYLTSTGFDSILAFDLDEQRFSWGLEILRQGDGGFQGRPFDPNGAGGPPPRNDLHLNMVSCSAGGMTISGLRTGALLIFNGETITPWATIPEGVHNAMPFRDGLIFNDTRANAVRFVTRNEERALRIPVYPEEKLTHTDLDDSRIARQGFGRGLTIVESSILAGGSSPSTITLYDIDREQTLGGITLTYDIRNAIHGLEVWPFD